MFWLLVVTISYPNGRADEFVIDKFAGKAAVGDCYDAMRYQQRRNPGIQIACEKTRTEKK